MPTQTVDLAEEYAAFIRQSVDEGRYLDANEVIGAGLRLLQQQDAQKLDGLRRLATEAFEGIDRGEFETVDSEKLDQFMDEADFRAREIRSQ
jgi:antitoxin ParD1/3/4